MPSRNTVRTSLPIGHVVIGDGPHPVLVLHDWNGDHTTWAPTFPYLDRATFTWVFVDLRGYGLSRAIAGAHTLDEIAADCLDLADRLGFARFHVVGHSMTGMATQRLAVDAPERVVGAVAICPVSAAGGGLDEAAAAFFARTIDDDDAFRRLIRFVSGGLGAGWVEVKLRQNRERVDPACRADYLEMFATANFVDEVVGDETPFRVVVGDHDPGLDAVRMRETFLAQQRHADLVVIGNCGHYPMQECPPRLVEVMEEHLRRHLDRGVGG